MFPFGGLLGIGSPFADSFARADQNLEASAPWTRLSGIAGGLKIVSGQVTNNAAGDGTHTVYSAPSRTSGQFFSQVRLFTPGGGNGPFLAAYIVDANNWVGYRDVNGSLARSQAVSGTISDFGLGGSLTSGQIMKVIVSTEARTLAVYYNGTLLRTDGFPAGLSGAGRRTGMVCNYSDTDHFLDDFLTDNL